ncbi:hypothetical protein EDB83DRAFT_2436447 [Lactarius deliciosus]|nr:hypothetical protein EDB83DRAFT_2444608 [Lactarius deliciosus]KAH9018355.1 hypothetical protein EDB83DRAFT_2436447 [Lactarius deliciosus]
MNEQRTRARTQKSSYITPTFLSSTMSGLNGHYSDSFFNDDYNNPYGNSSHYERMLSNPPQHVDPNSSLSGPFSSVSKAITCASHEALIRCGNTAYTSMHTQFLRAKCELEAERNTTTRLQDIINTLAASRTMPATPQNIARDAKPETLDIADAPEMLEEGDYPDVPYWHELNWADYCERQKDRGNSIHKLGFLTNKDGDPAVESRVREFMTYAKQSWNELYRHRLDPPSWTKKTLPAATFFAHEMKVHFSEFRYCDDNWKAERFAIIKYPDWCRDVRESGRLTRIRPSKHKTNEDNGKKEDRKRKKAKTKAAAPPPGVQVIDLDNSSSAGSTPTHPTPPATSIPATIPQRASPALTEPVPLRPPSPPSIIPTLTNPASLFHPTLQDRGASLALTEPAAPCPSTPQDTLLSSALTKQSEPAPPCPPTPSREGAPQAPTEPATLRSPIQNQLDLPVAGIAPATSESAPALVCPTQPSSDSPTPPGDSLVSEATSPPPARPQVNTTPQLSGAAGGRSGRRRVNPLAGISIPKPLFQVPSEELDAASSLVAMSTSRSSKSEKLMVAAPNLLTARNLFASDYLKEHPLTKSGFKAVWDNLDSETKKKYEALSKERKLAARVASAATPSV